MRFLDVVGMCLRNLWKRKLRTILTMLGVVIGTASLVLTVSLGLANEARFDRMVEAWDRDLSLINVSPGGDWFFDPNTNEWAPDGAELNDDAIAAFRSIPNVRMASPMMWSRTDLFIRSGIYAMDAWNIQGMDPSALPYLGRELMYGRFLEPDDPFGSVVIGAHVELGFEILGVDWMQRTNRRNFMWQGLEFEDVPQYVDMMNEPLTFSYDRNYTWRAAVGEDIEDAFRPIRSFPLNVVGIFEPSGVNWDGIDQNIFMDVNTLQELSILSMEARRESEQEWGNFSPIPPTLRETYDNAVVRVDDIRVISYVAEEIRDMGYQAWYEAEWINRQREVQEGTIGMLVAIAAVAIVVAAISIANTMIMAVYERTREIGVMKVIGGSIADIRKMFLLEAALIGLFGGILGVGVSLIGAYVMNNMEIEALINMGLGTTEEGDVTALITTWLMGVALLFASVIGLVSGYFPARRATKLSALEAIRTD